MNYQNNIELGDVVRRFGPAYIEAQGERILPSQLKALNDIAKCRTEALGGRMYRCSECHKDFWVYHSCRNRSCPACHGRDTRLWLQKREAQLLGCDYYHVIVTVPGEIRAAFLADQKRLYSLFMKTAANSVIDLSRDERFVGGIPAILMVLHTWSTDIQYHPHVHMLVSAGGVSENGNHWLSPRNAKWLIPVKALSKLVRNRFRKCLECISPRVCASLPQRIWENGWNAFCKHFGKGEKAVLDYLGRYVFRIAITNARIVGMDETHVTFRSKNHKTGKWRNVKLRGEEFLRRFVMHVLPKGFHKVRYYGLWHHSKKELQVRARLLLEPIPNAEKVSDLLMSIAFDGENQDDSFKPECPRCGCKKVLLVFRLDRTRSP
jgi:hypothetical protein